MLKCSLLLLFLLPLAVAQSSPAFVEELLPSAEKTALLYHLSYLSLAQFPNLERNIRSRAVETQKLFEDSDATMQKCVLTSRKLVHTLFPMVLTAVEKNIPELAVDNLKKAQGWITDIINDVDRMVDKYESHNRDVASSTSDVIKEKQDTNAKITAQSLELQQTENTLNTLKSELQSTTAELTAAEQKIRSKNQEIQDFTRSITQTNIGLTIFAAVVPFIGLIVKSIYDAVNNPQQVAHMKALEHELNILIADKNTLRQKQWQLQLQITDWQMKAAKASFDLNAIPDPFHLEEVQISLTKIQAIMLQLKDFWEGVSKVLGQLEQKTFAGEYLMKYLDKVKQEFIKSIEAAKQAWNDFGKSCERTASIFKQQSADAYKFLEVSHSSLSKEQWQEEYERVKTRLEAIEPSQCPLSTERPAITQSSHSAPSLER